MIVAKIRHLLGKFSGMVILPYRRIAELKDQLARERAQRQFDAMHRKQEDARPIRHMARIQLELATSNIRPLMLDGMER